MEMEEQVGNQVEIPAIGRVTVPPPGLLAVFGVIDWPIALVVGVGHLLADQHWSSVVQGIGEAAEQA